MPQNKNKRFTSSEIDFIKNNADSMTVKNIAQKLGRTERGVRGKIERMKIKLSNLERNKPYEWTKSDIELLKNNFKLYSDENLVKKFFPQLSVSQIIRKRFALGLYKEYGKPYINAGDCRDFRTGHSIKQKKLIRTASFISKLETA